MNKRINLSIDIIILVITSIWISDLNFSNLKILQIIGLILTVIMIVLMIIKIIKKGD